MMTREHASALMRLQMHWDEWYVISYNPDSGIWLAQYRGALEKAPLNAETSLDLGDMLADDFSARREAERRTLVEHMST